jgi:3-methyladenine DNA glycosylase AlkD
MTTAAEVVAELSALADQAEHAKTLGRVGDPEAVLGVRMREVFGVAKRHTSLDLTEVAALLAEPSYEARMVAVSILDFKARRRATPAERRSWAELYLNNHDRLDQWDFVDRAAPRVIGGWLLEADPTERTVLTELAASPDPNRRRTAITATFWLIRHGQLDDALAIAERLVDDPEVLVRNSVGVALREVGRVDVERRDAFVAEHPERISRPVLRVALSA